MNRKIWKALGIAVCMLALAAPRAMAETAMAIVPWPETVTTATPLATAAASYTVCCGSPPILQRHAAIVWPSDVSVTSNTQTGPRI